MAMTLITTNTSSNAASSSFTSGIDSTYKLYIFKFIDVNPATDRANFQFQVNATDGADYNDSQFTSTSWYASHYEDDNATNLTYTTTHHQSNDAGFQSIGFGVGNAADESCAGELYLFNPSSTTYVKHFYSRISALFSVPSGADGEFNCFTGGYVNDTTAIDDIQFKMSSGNMDAVIKMYGVG